LAREKLAPGSKYSFSKLRRIAEPARAGADFELVALELERHRAARQTARLEPRGNLLRQRPQPALERPEGGEVAVESRFRRHAFGFPLRRHLALVDAAREPRKAQPLDAVAARKVAFRRDGEIADPEEAVALEPRLARLAHAPDEADRLPREERARLRAAHHG